MPGADAETPRPGVLTGVSEIHAAINGPRPAEAARMAIEDAGGPVLGHASRAPSWRFAARPACSAQSALRRRPLIAAILAPAEEATMSMGWSPTRHVGPHSERHAGCRGDSRSRAQGLGAVFALKL